MIDLQAEFERDYPEAAEPLKLMISNQMLIMRGLASLLEAQHPSHPMGKTLWSAFEHLERMQNAEAEVKDP